MLLIMHSCGSSSDAVMDLVCKFFPPLKSSNISWDFMLHRSCIETINAYLTVLNLQMLMSSVRQALDFC